MPDDPLLPAGVVRDLSLRHGGLGVTPGRGDHQVARPLPLEGGAPLQGPSPAGGSVQHWCRPGVYAELLQDGEALLDRAIQRQKIA